MAEQYVGKTAEFKDGDRRIIFAGDNEIGIFRHEGAFYAYSNFCLHQGGPACEGLKMPQVVEKIGDKGVHLGMDFDETDMHIVCPWHGYEFHLSDGYHVADRRLRLQKFDVIERDGEVYVAV